MVRLPLTVEEVERGQRLGALLRNARGERSMLDVALSAGVSPETLRKIETGRVATPAFPTIAALAGALGLSLDSLWNAVNQTGDATGRETEAAGHERQGPPARLAS